MLFLCPKCTYYPFQIVLLIKILQLNCCTWIYRVHIKLLLLMVNPISLPLLIIIQGLVGHFFYIINLKLLPYCLLSLLILKIIFSSFPQLLEMEVSSLILHVLTYFIVLVLFIKNLWLAPYNKMGLLKENINIFWTL